MSCAARESAWRSKQPQPDGFSGEEWKWEKPYADEPVRPHERERRHRRSTARLSRTRWAATRPNARNRIWRYPRVTRSTNENGLHLCKPLIYLVAGAGFEPATFGL